MISEECNEFLEKKIAEYVRMRFDQKLAGVYNPPFWSIKQALEDQKAIEQEDIS